jgi:protein phosphatase
LAPLPPGHHLALIADGMGGHVAGATASVAVCSAFLQDFRQRFIASEQGLMDRLVESLEIANGELTRRIRTEPGLDGMGTTLLAAYVLPHELGSGLTWISVGDSLLYLWRRGDLARLNEDHSLAPTLDRLVAEGRMTSAAADIDPRRHYLRSAVTGGDIEMIDVTPRPLPLAEGDVVIAASDGLHTLEDEEIRELVCQARNQGAPGITEALIAEIDARGVPHQDNTTVAVLVVGSDHG